MPKLKDLGVKVLPDTMRPPEIGGGGPLTDGCDLNTQCAGTFGMSNLCGVAAAAADCPVFTVCTTAQIAAGGGLTREHIASLRTQLQEQLKQLDQAEKDQIDARQKQVEDELAQLKQRRKDLK